MVRTFIETIDLFSAKDITKLFDKAKALFPTSAETAWRRLSDEEKNEVFQIIEDEFENSENVDFDDIKGVIIYAEREIEKRGYEEE